MQIKFTALLLFVLCSIGLTAQEIRWNVGLETVFDNREYTNSEINASQTIFGAIVSPEIGVRWDKYHSLMAGAHFTFEFGSPSKDILVDPTVYYNFNNKRFNISAGLLPFNQVIGSESRAFFSDSVRFFKKTIGGVLLQYVKGKNYAEVYFDWDGRKSDTRREKFTVYSSGRIAKGVFFGTYEISMHHYAGSNAAESVVDNVWLNPAIGLDLSRKLWLDSLTVGVGFLQSFQNDRGGDQGYVSPRGGEVNIRVEKYNIGIYNTLFFGDNMMPYHPQYGGGLYWGEPFYSTSNRIYNRLEIYWTPLKKKFYNLKIASIHHYDGSVWSWQQFAKFSVTINQDLFKKKKRD